MGSKFSRRSSPLIVSELTNARPKADVVVEHRPLSPLSPVPKKITSESLRLNRRQASTPVQETHVSDKGPENRITQPPTAAPSRRMQTIAELGKFTPSRPSSPKPVPSVATVDDKVEVKIKEPAPAQPTFEKVVPEKVTAAPKKPRRSPRRPAQPDEVSIDTTVGQVAKLLSFTTRILFAEGGLNAAEEMEFVGCVAEIINSTAPRKSGRKDQDPLVSYFVDGVTKDVPISYVLADLMDKIAMTQKDVATKLSEKLRIIYT